MTIQQAKNNLISTLDSMDQNKMSLPDLQIYANILKIVSEIQTKSYAETLAETFSGIGFGLSIPTVSELK